MISYLMSIVFGPNLCTFTNSQGSLSIHNHKPSRSHQDWSIFTSSVAVRTRTWDPHLAIPYRVVVLVTFEVKSGLHKQKALLFPVTGGTTIQSSVQYIRLHSGTSTYSQNAEKCTEPAKYIILSRIIEHTSRNLWDEFYGAWLS